MLKADRERVEDEGRPGRAKRKPATDEAHVHRIKELLLENRRLTTRKLAEAVGISNGSANTIVTEHLCLERVKSRMVAKTQQYVRKRVSRDREAMLSDHQNVLKGIITGDETWIHA